MVGCILYRRLVPGEVTVGGQVTIEEVSEQARCDFKDLGMAQDHAEMERAVT